MLIHRHGKQAGTRQMIELLGLGKKHGCAPLQGAVATALATGCGDVAAVRATAIFTSCLRKVQEEECDLSSITARAVAGLWHACPSLISE